MKALVTGASGFIGSTLIEQLSSMGLDVFALMRKTSDASNLAGVKYQRCEGDLSNLDSLKAAVKGMDYVFHLAGATAAPDRQGYFRHNAEGTANIAQAVADNNPGVKRFVYVSSQAAAGPSDSLKPRVESDPEKPVSAYGESKLEGERQVLKHKSRFPVAIVRPPMVYGPKDKGVYVIIQTVAKNLMPVMKGSTPDGHKYYSAVHVHDLCDGIIRAGMAPSDKVASGEIFYVTSDEMHTYRELLETMAGALNLRPLAFPVPKFAITAAAYGMAGVGKLTGKTYPLNIDKLNEILPDYWICSNQKAKDLLNFTPKYDLKTGMANAIEWYKKNRWL